MAKSNKRPLAVLQVKHLRSIGDYILKVRTIVLNVGNNVAYFATPAPTLASITTAVGNLETAEALAETRVAGAAATRNVKYDIVVKAVHGLLNYVQTVADNAADTDTSIAIIEASGFSLRNNGVRAKPDFVAKNGTVSGAVKLVAKAAGIRASYEWQQSTDGTNWTPLPSTLKAKTTVENLPAGAKMYFRKRATTPDGTGNWSQTQSLIVT